MLRAWLPKSSIGCVCLSVGSAEILSLPRNNLRLRWTQRPMAWLQDPGKGVWGGSEPALLGLKITCPCHIPWTDRIPGMVLGLQ